MKQHMTKFDKVCAGICFVLVMAIFYAALANLYYSRVAQMEEAEAHALMAEVLP